MTTPIRNICIIAHVDHGKTTLVDHLLRQSGTFQGHQALEERVMDSMDLERERGITIMAKNTSVRYQGTKINIVDTPGHADFGGEVERILGMVDGSLLLVDAAEGPLPQTRFVLQKSLAQGHRVILVINKVDRPECSPLNGNEARIQEVVNQTFDLFCELGANETQLEFPIIYACARQGWCTSEFSEIADLISNKKTANLEPLFKLVLQHVAPPEVSSVDQPFQMLVSNLSYSEYVGRLAIGRVRSGRTTKGKRIIRRGWENGQDKNENFTVSQVYSFEGLKQAEVPEVVSGDIVAVAGSELFDIGDTIVEAETVPALPRIKVEPPTIGMIFSVNTSPLSGQEGEAIQSRKLRERLLREVRHNVAIRFEDIGLPDQFRLLGRGELQFAILIEQMRREGSEFMVGKPKVLFKEEDGNKMEPLERVTLDLPEVHCGEVTQLFQVRKGTLTHYDAQMGQTRARLQFEVPTRGLLGIRSRYLTITRGDGLFSSEVVGYVEYKGQIIHRVNGALVSDRKGDAVEYGLMGLEDRGALFVVPGTPVYEGMVIGENNKDNDLNVNPCREKKLTNIRSAHAEVLVTLNAHRKMSLEQYIEWIDDDEWIEITPKTVRVRKKILQGNLRSVKRFQEEE